ncbi:uncharacterized protein LOC111870280 isoform X2 [Cryptotermes secundus]|uniref:uncharacterized protein LOC111870280 isoform X2 n=1 Tax=Cryptotermes secundus TaxID=105785 RepID=UPI000CD7AD16|nr:uncharacterized protein LOC111870280 isoform X2 [Cryptotermes secundus]
MCAFGRYIDCIDVNLEKVVIEVRVLECVVKVKGKQIRTNKWLLPYHWKEVYSILHTAAENHMKNELAETVVAQGKDTQVAENYSEFGSCGLKSSAYARNRIRNLKLNSVADDKFYSEIIWQTVEDFQRIPNDIKLRKEAEDRTNAYVATDSLPGYSDDCDSYSCESDTPEKFFTIEKYSKYTGAVIRQYVNPDSPEHSSPNSKHKCDFHFSNLGAEVESVNSKPTSAVSVKFSPRKKQNISHDCSGAKDKQRPKCDSSSDDDRHHLSKTRNARKYEGKFCVNRPKWKNMANVIYKEEGTSGSKWKMENDMLNDPKTVTENPTRCYEDTISERRKVDSTAENKGKSELQSRGAYTSNRTHKTCSMETDVVMKVTSFKETSADNKYIRRGNSKESDSAKTRISQLNNKRTHKNNRTINHYFQTKKTEHVSLFGSSEESVETPHISSTDDCVPGTPIHTTQFGIQLISKTENLSVESPVSLGHCVREPKCSVRIQQTKSEPVDYDTDKSSSKAKLSGYSNYTKKKKCSILSARRKRHKSAAEISKRASGHIPSYFGSQVGKSDRKSSLQNVYQQQLKSVVQAVNEGELLPSSSEESGKGTAISEDLLLCGAEQKELKIVPDVFLKTKDNFETNHGQEAVTSSNNQEDFKVSHLTLEELEQKFKSNVKYLYGILKGEIYCWRHEQFKKGGTDSRNLCYAVSTIPYTDSQLNHLLFLIRNTFYRKYSYMNHFDYIMKVLLPEATTKIFMDQFSLSHEQTLQKIHKIHIASDTPDEKSLPW